MAVTNGKDESLKSASLYMLLARLGMMALAFLTHVINTRVLGPELFGVLALSIAMVRIVTGLESGISSAATKFLAESYAQKDAKGGYAIYATCFGLETGIVFLSAILLGLTGLSSSFWHGHAYLLWIVIPVVTASIYYGFVSNAMTAFKRLKLPSVIHFTQGAIYTGLVIVLVIFTEFGVHSALWAWFVAIVVCNLVLYVAIKPLVNKNFEVNPKREYRRMLTYAMPVTLATFVNTIIASGGPVILGFLSRDLVSIGYFGVLLALGMRGRTVMMSLYRAAFPYMASWLVTNNRKKIVKLTVVMSLTILGLMGVCVLVLPFIGKSIVLFLYGNQYDPVAQYLVLASIVFLLGSLRDWLNVVLNAVGRPGKNLWGILGGLLVFVCILAMRSSEDVIWSLLIAMGAGYCTFCLYGTLIFFWDFDLEIRSSINK